MTTAEFFSGQAQTASYVYDGDGRRVKRLVGTAGEVWQIYGAAGELLAEYSPNGSPTQPVKEYGYRGGELLITAEALPRTNVALSSNGGVATASSNYGTGWNYTPANAINGDRKGVSWAAYANNPAGGGWNDDSPANSFPDWLEVEFAGSKRIDEVDVFTLQDNYASPVEPTEAQTFTQYGLTAYEVQYWDGAGWVTVEGGSVTGSNKVWRRFTFAAVVTSKVRVVTHASADGYSRVTEVEAWGWGTGGAAQGAEVRWLVTDQVGTPRMVVDHTGSLAGVTRHDYLPFGEELSAGTGGRTPAQGYSAADNVRQQFTKYERDEETGLDFAQARMYANQMGRFTSADPVLMSKDRILDPQGINLYAYCANNPLIHTDPDGKYFVGTNGKRVQVSLQKDRLVVGRNASADLRRIVNLTNQTGSKTAVSSLLDTANSATRVNYRISKGEGVYTDPVTGKSSTPLYGLTQPHDKAGKPLVWSDALKGFAGTPEYIKDNNGNLVYKEATITIYEGSLKGKGLTQFGSGATHVVNDPNVTTNEALVISTAHEETHVTGQEGVDNIRNHTLDSDPEAAPFKVHNQVDQEIQQHRSRP